MFHVRLTYGLNRPPLRDEKIPVGVLPFTNFVPTGNALQLSKIYDGDPNQLLFGQSQNQPIPAGTPKY